MKHFVLASEDISALFKKTWYVVCCIVLKIISINRFDFAEKSIEQVRIER